MGLFDFFKKEKSDVEKYYDERKTQNPVSQSTNNYPTPAIVNNYTGNNAFKIVIEDIFAITGRGIVITGTISEGQISVGEIVTLVKLNGMRKNVTVTGIEKFRARLDTARAGENVGILISGVDRSELERGDVLIK